MKLSASEIRAGMLAIGLVLAASVSLSATAAGNTKAAPDSAYLENIITVLRAHVNSMRAIIENDDLKYSDNMLRHARAFERAVGMVGPMDWHAARAFDKARVSGGSITLTEAEFDQLAQASDRQIKAINREANRYMKDKDAARMHDAINNMIRSCSACHSQMPEGTVPGVWADMAE